MKTAQDYAQELERALFNTNLEAKRIGDIDNSVLIHIPDKWPRLINLITIEHEDGQVAALARLNLTIQNVKKDAPEGARVHFVAVNPNQLDVRAILRKHFWPAAFQSWQQMFKGQPCTILRQRLFSSWDWIPGHKFELVRGENYKVLKRGVTEVEGFKI